MNWINVNDRLPKKAGFYGIKGLNNQGNPVENTGKDAIWFTGNPGKIWIIREGCKVTHWDEINPPAEIESARELTSIHQYLDALAVLEKSDFKLPSCTLKYDHEFLKKPGIPECPECGTNFKIK